VYSDGSLNEQNMMGKDVAYNCEGPRTTRDGEPPYMLETHGHAVGRSETGTTLPFSSPPSFFSAPPDHGPAVEMVS
jgi:hypothetical protein